MVLLLRHTQLTNDAYSLSLPATTIYNDRIRILTKKLFGSSFVVGFDSDSDSDNDSDFNFHIISNCDNRRRSGWALYSDRPCSAGQEGHPV